MKNTIPKWLDVVIVGCIAIAIIAKVMLTIHYNAIH